MPHNRYGRPPMTLANMRDNGVRSLSVTCDLCSRGALLNVDAFRQCDAGSRLRPAHGLHDWRDRRRIREAQSWSTDRETCFWGTSFQLTGRKGYGRGTSLNEAKVGFWAECAAWGEGQKGQDCRRDQCKR
jgi:hypothetical protein